MDKSQAPVIVIFGVTGDLSKRYLLPALYHLIRQQVLPADTRLVGVSRRPLEASEFLKTVELCVLEKDKVCDPVGLERMGQALQTIQLDPTNDDDYRHLKQLLDSFDERGKRARLLYMAIPASAYGPLVEHLANHGLNDSRSRLLLEKPFGYDLDSARQLISLVDKSFPETQIYRIDHYLAKETAQELLNFRLKDPDHAKLWSGQHIKQVHIRALQTIGIEGRVNFYEQTGALRDFVQSHLMQLLAITLMEPPADMSSQAIHASKLAFFKQLRPADPQQAIRGQYDSYRQEVDNPSSWVETYARLKLENASEQWQATEIILETGKAMDRHLTEVVVKFRSSAQPELRFQIQPPPKPQQIDAYERVLMDAVKGDQSLFASDQDVVTTWRVLQPLLDAWQSSDNGLVIYPAGTAGPATEA